MDNMARAKMWIGGLTDIGLMLLGLAIVAALLGAQAVHRAGLHALLIRIESRQEFPLPSPDRRSL